MHQIHANVKKKFAGHLQGCVNQIWFLSPRVSRCPMSLQGHYPASEPGVSTVLEGGALLGTAVATALKDGASTGGVAAGKAPQGA